MRWLFLFVLLFAVACGGGDDDESGPGDAGEAAKEQFEMALKGQWGRVYDNLHPEHQAIVDRDLYIRCQSEQTFPDLEVEVEDVFEETLDVPGLGETATTAVTLRFSNEDISEFDTSHVINVDGEWRWVLQQDGLTAFEAGECPA